jgi:hypothetical protein
LAAALGLGTAEIILLDGTQFLHRMLLDY